MALQGLVQADHVPVNNYQLTITGSGNFPANTVIFFVEVSGIELETQSVDLPDRTKASGGQFARLGQQLPRLGARAGLSALGTAPEERGL